MSNCSTHWVSLLVASSLIEGTLKNTLLLFFFRPPTPFLFHTTCFLFDMFGEINFVCMQHSHIIFLLLFGRPYLDYGPQKTFDIFIYVFINNFSVIILLLFYIVSKTVKLMCLSDNKDKHSESLSFCWCWCIATILHSLNNHGYETKKKCMKISLFFVKK